MENPTTDDKKRPAWTHDVNIRVDQWVEAFDGHYRLHLGLPQMEELEKKLSRGILAIYGATMRGRYEASGEAVAFAAKGAASAQECYEVIVVAERGRGWLPTEGGLFIAEYVSPPTSAYGFEQRTWEIVTTWEGPRGWWAGTPNRGRSGTFFVSDGPYADPCTLAGKLIGRVVGMVATRNLQVRS